jgi:hypothetical protein
VNLVIRKTCLLGNLKNKPKTAKVKIKKRLVTPNPNDDSLSRVGVRVDGQGVNPIAVPVGYDPVVNNLTNTTLYNSKNKENK